MKPNQMNVLLIEDDTNTRSTLRMMLQEMGITQVYESTNGSDAMEYVDKTEGKNLDLVICDWNMPGKTGFEVLEEIRAIDTELPFLMVTARADQESVTDAKDAGVSGYIRKPFTLDELEKKVKAVIKKEEEKPEYY